jgi:hypothetical protein
MHALGGRRRRGGFGLVLAGCALALAAPGAARALTFTYTIESRGDVQADVGEFASFVGSVLSDDRGWTLEGAITFRRVASGGNFGVILASPEAVDAAHPVCSPVYSCRVGDQVLINDLRWRTATDAWTGTLAGYRTYLVNHEVGHWLGLGHFSCPQQGALAPVMQQQSISLQGCRPNAWPLDFERNRVASIWDVRIGGPERAWPVPIPGWFWEWARWYRGHGEFRDRPFRSAATRPDAAPIPIPDWAWRRLEVMIGEGAGTRGRPWPVPLPGWFWEWARWYLDRGEFRDQPFRSPQTRPAAAPTRIPEWGWVRLRVLLGEDVEEE